MDSDNSDDEYGPVVAAWGDQAQPTNTSIDSTNAPPSGWDTLLDPTFKIKTNGIGSGDLHRKGRNYKPVNEDEILRQRLKLPSTQSSNKKKRPSKASSKASSYHDSNGKQQQQKRPIQSKPSTSSMKRSQALPPPLPPSTLRPPPKLNNAWTQQSLVSEPFWEHPPPSSGQQNNQQQATRSSSSAAATTTATTTRSATEREDYGGMVTSLKPDPRPQRPASMRPPPGLFRNAINQLEDNINSPSKRPPGLSPIPVNPNLQHHPFKPAPPPPPTKQQINPVVIRINIELESGNTVQVPVRLYDDPLALANEFSRSHNVTSPQVVMHLQKLFKDQQELAIRKRHPNM